MDTFLRLKSFYFGLLLTGAAVLKTVFQLVTTQHNTTHIRDGFNLRNKKVYMCILSTFPLFILNPLW